MIERLEYESDDIGRNEVYHNKINELVDASNACELRYIDKNNSTAEQKKCPLPPMSNECPEDCLVTDLIARYKIALEKIDDFLKNKKTRYEYRVIQLIVEQALSPQNNEVHNKDRCHPEPEKPSEEKK